MLTATSSTYNRARRRTCTACACTRRARVHVHVSHTHACFDTRAHDGRDPFLSDPRRGSLSYFDRMRCSTPCLPGRIPSLVLDGENASSRVFAQTAVVASANRLSSLSSRYLRHVCACTRDCATISSVPLFEVIYAAISRSARFAGDKAHIYRGMCRHTVRGTYGTHVCASRDRGDRPHMQKGEAERGEGRNVSTAGSAGFSHERANYRGFKGRSRVRRDLMTRAQIDGIRRGETFGGWCRDETSLSSPVNSAVYDCATSCHRRTGRYRMRNVEKLVRGWSLRAGKFRNREPARRTN